MYTFLWAQAHTQTHTFLGETAALPVRPQVSINSSKLLYRDRSQFISVRQSVTETGALTEVKLTNLPTGNRRPAHILRLCTAEVCYRSAGTFTVRRNLRKSVSSSPTHFLTWSLVTSRWKYRGCKELYFPGETSA